MSTKENLAVVVSNETECQEAIKLLNSNFMSHTIWDSFPGPLVVTKASYCPVYSDRVYLSPAVTHYKDIGYRIFPTVDMLEEYIRPNPEKDYEKYIFLEEGDTIREGDEFWNGWSWYETLQSGDKVESNSSGAIQYRRKVSC